MSDGSVRSGANGASTADARAIVTMFVVGTFAPLVVAVRYEGFLELYVGSLAYSALAGTAFGLAAWVLVDRLDLDRRTVGQTAVFGPILLVGIVAPTLALLGLDLRSFVLRDEFLWYPLSISAGGGLAVALSAVTERLSAHHAVVPERRTVTLAVGTTALLGLGAAAGRRSVAAWHEYSTLPGGTIEGAWLAYYQWNARVWPKLDVESTPFRVTVVAPDGTIASERVTIDDRDDGSPSVAVPYPDGSIHRGRFEVRLESVRGDVSDSTTVAVEDGPVPSIRRVDTRTTGRNSRIADVVVENEGDVTGDFEIELRDGDGKRLDGDSTAIGPGAEIESTLVIDHDDRAERRSAVVAVQFEGPESDSRADREPIEFPADR